MVGIAIRYEDFDDFGTTTNGKMAANWRVNDRLVLRGSGTGFKAPTPGQSNAFNVSTEFDLVTINDLVNNGTIPSRRQWQQLRGGKALEPEDSTNYTAGVFLQPGRSRRHSRLLQHRDDDRITVSQNFSLTQQEIDDLIAAGVTSAGNLQNFRFFTNDFDTETDGVDIVATMPRSGRWYDGLVLAFNYTRRR